MTLKKINNEPEFQNQHRLPQVYLKGFGFEENGYYYVSVLEKGCDKMTHKPIKEFTSEINIFDYTVLPDLSDSRHFEKLCSKIEDSYPRVMSTILSKRRLIERHKKYLCQFLATIICRAEENRSFYKNLLNDVNCKGKFLDEITFFNEDVRCDLDLICSNFNLDEQVRVISTLVGEHIARCLFSFSYVILKSPEDKGWFTSDNPVIIDKQDYLGSILPPEAEVYFPLSRDYCLFLYHKGSEIQNHPLRNLKENMVHDCDEVSHGYIHMQMARNIYKYLVSPMKMNQSFKPLSCIPFYS